MGAADLRGWSARLESRRARIQSIRFPGPDASAAAWIEASPDGGGGMLPLVVVQGGRACPVDERTTLHRDDEVVVAVSGSDAGGSLPPEASGRGTGERPSLAPLT